MFYGSILLAAHLYCQTAKENRTTCTYSYSFGYGGCVSTGIAATAFASGGFTESCSARKAMRSRVASALSACGASYTLSFLGSLTTFKYSLARSALRKGSSVAYCRKTLAGAACETYLPASVHEYFVK